MNEEKTVFGECRRCGEDATLSVAHPDGVFKDVCEKCYMESLQDGPIDTIRLRKIEGADGLDHLPLPWWLDISFMLSIAILTLIAVVLRAAHEFEKRFS